LNLNRPLDAVDWRILRALQENARVSFSDLGRLTALTPPAAAERVRRLEASGVIAGYRAELDLAALHLPIVAFVRVATSGQEKSVQFTTLARRLPEVLECHRVTGQESYIAKVAVPSVRELEAILERLTAYGQPTTSIVLSSPVRHRVIDPAAGATVRTGRARRRRLPPRKSTRPPSRVRASGGR